MKCLLVLLAVLAVPPLMVFLMVVAKWIALGGHPEDHDEPGGFF